MLIFGEALLKNCSTIKREMQCYIVKFGLAYAN